MALQRVQELSSVDTDISCHLQTLFEEAIRESPSLIVELGVRTGESSRVFDLVAREVPGCHVIGVDLDRCDYTVHNGTFIQMDDTELAPMMARIMGPCIDVLFIDTSHTYEHTKREIELWFPLTRSRAVIMLHDTNLRETYRRRNGTTAKAWDNQRGVVRAVEDYFGLCIDETKPYSVELEMEGHSYDIRHDPVCNGMMVIRKRPLE